MLFSFPFLVLIVFFTAALIPPLYEPHVPKVSGIGLSGVSSLVLPNALATSLILLNTLYPDGSVESWIKYLGERSPVTASLCLGSTKDNTWLTNDGIALVFLDIDIAFSLNRDRPRFFK